jgi:hypothetical protein
MNLPPHLLLPPVVWRIASPLLVLLSRKPTMEPLPRLVRTALRAALASVFVLLACPTARSQTALYTVDGDSAGDNLGVVSGAGDVNGDGFADLIVGIPLDDNNGTDSGSARVFSGVDGSVLYTFDGDS